MSDNSSDISLIFSGKRFKKSTAAKKWAKDNGRKYKETGTKQAPASAAPKKNKLFDKPGSIDSKRAAKSSLEAFKKRKNKSA